MGPVWCQIILCHYGTWLHYRAALVFFHLLRNISSYSEDPALIPMKTQAPIELGTIATDSKRQSLFLKTFLSKQTRYCQRFIFYSSVYNSCKTTWMKNKNGNEWDVMIPAVGWIHMEVGNPKPVKALRGIIVDQNQCENSYRLYWEPGFPLSVPIPPGACVHNTKQSCSDISRFPGTAGRVAGWSHCSHQGDEPRQSPVLWLCLWFHGAVWAQPQPCCAGLPAELLGAAHWGRAHELPRVTAVTTSLTYHREWAEWLMMVYSTPRSPVQGLFRWQWTPWTYWISCFKFFLWGIQTKNIPEVQLITRHIPWSDLAYVLCCYLLKLHSSPARTGDSGNLFLVFWKQCNAQ